MQRLFPELRVDLQKIFRNSLQTVSRCKEKGISVCGVIKGCSGLPEVARVMTEAGVCQLGTSRIEHAYQCKKEGIFTPFLLVRVPAMTEIPDVVQLFDYSLESEMDTVLAIDRECSRQQLTHKIVMMVDLGDLREGYWNKEKFIEDCLFLEKNLKYVILSGIGVNLGCYGAIKPTIEKMKELLSISRAIESEINRPLEIVSGGATTSYPLVHDGTMPKGINHLRIGDNILLSRGLQTNWKISDMDYLDMTSFLISAEVVEIKDKPSYPQGEFAFNAYGKLPEYEDTGIRKRALVALGNADVGNVMELVPVNDRIIVVGGSSDYMIIDVTECGNQMQIGDVVEFYPRYINMLHMTMSPNAKLTYV